MPGLAKLMEASESVAELSKVLVVKEKELAVATIKAEKVGNTTLYKATTYHSLQRNKINPGKYKDLN